jgi:cyclopropane fatty-acyl-phospholipid synthase-like methyltransferase
MSSSSQLSSKIKALQSRSWYYGPISRTEAVVILFNDGEFLVRDCISCPGAYVLTCRHADKILHFRINQIIERDVEEKVAHYYYQVNIKLNLQILHHSGMFYKQLYGFQF